MKKKKKALKDTATNWNSPVSFRWIDMDIIKDNMPGSEQKGEPGG